MMTMGDPGLALTEINSDVTSSREFSISHPSFFLHVLPHTQAVLYFDTSVVMTNRHFFMLDKE